MIEEWDNWIIDSAPADMIQELRLLLADRRRSHDNKLEALTLLTNMADEESLDLLRWYYKNADPGMELTAMLALMEAKRLNRETEVEPWHDELLEHIHEIADRLSTYPPERDSFSHALALALRLEGMQVEEGGYALLKYDGELIDISPLDFVINNQVLIAFWDWHDEEAALKNWAKGDQDEELPDPLNQFYSTLRAANLRWGIQIDISSDTLITNLIENIEIDHGRPRVEYILAMPKLSIGRN
jgi:hypothetical protein